MRTAPGQGLKAKAELPARAASGRALEDGVEKRWESATSGGTAPARCSSRQHLSCVVPGGGVWGWVAMPLPPLLSHPDLGVSQPVQGSVL